MSETQWQPIEAAPKDGRLVTIWDQDEDEEFDVFWDGFMWGNGEFVFMHIEWWKPWCPAAANDDRRLPQPPQAPK